MCKAPFLAVSPGRCPGPLAASSHRAKSILASRRSGRIMRSLPEWLTRQPLFHPKSPCCNQRHSFLFIFRELTGETKWTKFYAKDWSSEVLPFGFFSSFIPRNIYFPVALHSGRTRPPSWSSAEAEENTISLSSSSFTSTLFPDHFFPPFKVRRVC